MREVVMAGVVACALPLFAKIEMGTPFSDSAVLQRGMDVPVWGTADAGKRVTVAFAGAKVSTTVGADGRWSVRLPRMEASPDERTMTVTESEPGWFGSDTDAVEIGGILVGEVWFASGQSNMECPIWGKATRYRDGKGALMTSMTRLPLVRFAKNGNRWTTQPAKARSQGWKRFVPESFRESKLSAVAFYYARELHLALGVPVGVVEASWGGSNIDAWTPKCGYDDCDPSIRATADYEVKADWRQTDAKGPVGGPHQQPTVLFNGMVSSWAPMAMRGFIWYQGCYNNDEARLYRAKLHALYNGWSRAFGNPDLKLYLVQLAPYNQNWMGICMAQGLFVAEQGNAALAVTSDIGNFDDIHPNDKETVAQRLVVHALRRDYGFDIAEDDSPALRSARFASDGTVSLDFAHATDFYVYAPDRSRDAAFEVAGADGRWTAAKIVNYRKVKGKDGKDVDTDFIDGSTIAIRADSIAAPVRARYMGKPRTAGTLYNQASLPIGPFEVSRD